MRSSWNHTEHFILPQNSPSWQGSGGSLLPDWLEGDELGFLQLQGFLPFASSARNKLFLLGLNLTQDKFSLNLIIALWLFSTACSGF